jgi:competence protein ComEC
MIQVAESKGVKRTIAREGQVFRVSSSTELDVLYAPLDLEKIPEDVNDCSLVVMARVAGMRALLSGDIGPKAEDTLLGRHPNLECDLLKIPHQGAREAASARFYEACDPAVAAISVGRDNMYGHPAHECLELLASRGIRVARTDTDGDISLSVDNGRIGLVKARR